MTTENPFAFNDAQQPAEQAQQAAPAAAAPAPAATPAQPQQQAAPPAQPAAGGDDPFSAPAPQSSRPRVRDLYGRLLLVIPHKLEEGIPNRLQPGTTQDRMTADVIVLDGGTLHYGGRPEATPPTQHTKQVEVPHKIDRLFLSQAGLISQCRDALAKRLRNEPGMVLGRLATGEAKEGGQNPPYLLTPPTEDEKNVARQYLATVDPFA